MSQCSVVLLISTYDLGRQPFGLASAAAALRAAGIDVVCADLAKERLSEESVRRAAAIGFFLPMHTATRLALPVIDRVRALNPDARLVAYGLYAPLNAPMLRERGASVIIGGEFEDALVAAVASSHSRPIRTAPIGIQSSGLQPRGPACLACISWYPIARGCRR